MYQPNNCLYEFEGPFIFRVLDNNNFMVLEINQQKINFFGFDKERRININSFGMNADRLVLNEELLTNKKIIIPGLCKDFIYSFELEAVISDFFNKITFDEENWQFLVIDEISTLYGPVTLQGIVDMDGFLLNESMYSKELNKTFYINPLDKDNSIYNLFNKIEKLMKRKSNKDYLMDLINYKKECYLTRKRKKTKTHRNNEFCFAYLLFNLYEIQN